MEAFTASDYTQAVPAPARPAALALPLSLAIRACPFCESLCYYCACNKIITKHHERSATYLRYLAREVDLHPAHRLGRTVTQLPWVAARPVPERWRAARELMAMLAQLHAGGRREYSIEVDPRTVDAGRLQTLAELVFNRHEFWRADFDPDDAEKAVYRIQPDRQVFALVSLHVQFDSVNVDLIHGLPVRRPSRSHARLAVARLRRPHCAVCLCPPAGRFKPRRRIVLRVAWAVP